MAPAMSGTSGNPASWPLPAVKENGANRVAPLAVTNVQLTFGASRAEANARVATQDWRLDGSGIVGAGALADATYTHRLRVVRGVAVPVPPFASGNSGTHPESSV